SGAGTATDRAAVVKLPGADRRRAVARETRDADRPVLVLVPRTRGRGLGVVTIIAIFGAVLFAVVALQTHMAQQQVRLDKMNSDIARARRHFETLRAERAELQSPTHLIARANEFGMVPGVSVRPIEIPAAIAAEVAANVGKIDEDVASSAESPLDEFGRLKPAVVGG
ncbi:MAG: hypothetical protein ACO3RB_09365, partial [Ilumatobacteraceae bacterium]